MKFCAIADTDIGISKDTNQDSVLIKKADTKYGEIVLAVICDGMGGLAKGEVASATVVRVFDSWFEEELPGEISGMDLNIIGNKWELMLKDLNLKILEYGKKSGENMGTTFTGILMFGDKYLIGHVGDTRIYHISAKVRQITEDQTVVAKAVKMGEITKEQAKNDRRKNMLLQCIGASKVVTPQIVKGDIEKGMYMICSDGFRHQITEEEIYESLNPANMVNKQAMHSNVLYLIDLVKKRKEKDNISVVLIKAE